MSKHIPLAEVAAHNTLDGGLYIIIDSNVYDLTNFIDEHPGGSKIIKRMGGKDASKQFVSSESIVSSLKANRTLFSVEG